MYGSEIFQCFFQTSHRKMYVCICMYSKNFAMDTEIRLSKPKMCSINQVFVDFLACSARLDAASWILAKGVTIAMRGPLAGGVTISSSGAATSLP